MAPMHVGRAASRSARRTSSATASGNGETYKEQEAATALDLPFESQQQPTRTAARPVDQGTLKPGDLLQGRYTIMDVLGSGSNATTYLARSSEGKQVAIKALSLRSMKDWKQLDLFQREAQVLASLQHPSIPRYIDYFEQDDEQDRSFYIVQEVVAGKSLAQMISEGRRATDAEALAIAKSLLEVLDYLGSLRPGVIHRDIKPENIVMEGGSWAGRPFLVDFGGVQGIASDAASAGSTIIGTYGYMAPEQFRGAAQAASDLYGLGATLLFLLTGRAPFSFPQERMRLQWRDAVQFPAGSVWPTLLDSLLEPVAEDRLTAKQALAVLRGDAPESALRRRGAGIGGRRAQQQEQALLTPPRNAREAWLRMQAAKQGVVTTKPAGSRVQIERSATRLDITVPPKGLTMDTGFTGAFAVAWNAFVGVWTVSALASGGILFALFSLPFWFAGVQIGRQAVVGALMRERFAVGLNKFRMGQELALFNGDGDAEFKGSSGNEKVVEGATSQLLGARVITTMFVNDQPQTAIEVVEGVNKYRFGEGLELAEQQWIVSEINSQLEAMRGVPVDYDRMPEEPMPESYYNDSNTRGGVGPP